MLDLKGNVVFKYLGIFWIQLIKFMGFFIIYSLVNKYLGILNKCDLNILNLCEIFCVNEKHIEYFTQI